MSKLRFALIGDGHIARHHRKAIEHVGGVIGFVVDPKYDATFNYNTWRGVTSIPQCELISCDYFIICSPSDLHREQIKFLLSNGHGSAQIICEKPAFLPWEPIIDSDRLNIVMQLRYIKGLPVKADLVTAHFIRDEKYFYSWKGDPKKTGGLFFNLWIHHLDLSHRLNADFEGSINLPDDEIPSTIDLLSNKKLKPVRRSIHYRKQEQELPGGQTLNIIDLQKINMQACYNAMYEDIVSGGGIKPKDIFYLSWTLQRNSEIFGYGKNGMNRLIRIGKELL